MVTGLAWLAAMGWLYYTHYIAGTDPELGYYSSDIVMKNETRRFYDVTLDDRKFAYYTASRLANPEFFLIRETTAIKLNLAGMSREAFTQSTARIDSITHRSNYLEFNIQSGDHSYVCSCAVHGDSLVVDVKASAGAPWRRGIFIIKGPLAFPVTLWHYLRFAPDHADLTVFDPVRFEPVAVTADREGHEEIALGQDRYAATRYRLLNGGRETRVWLDDDGFIIRGDGALFFGGVFGPVAMTRATTRDVFLLPLQVNNGNDILKTLTIDPGVELTDPRSCRYLEVRFDRLRAANVDVNSSFKEVLSTNPLLFALYNRPVTKEEDDLLELVRSAADTAVTGNTDYIQPLDGRIRRQAEAATAGVADTLGRARAVNRWVHDSMTREPGLDIIRSVDVLANLRGDHEEYTKLFTAMTRSLGIPTQIYLGLVYEDGRFRYHSWPGVFAAGIWHQLDPLYGQDAVDATHIPLVLGDYDRLVELLRITDQLGCTIVSHR